jgi:two-component system, NarL family, sensor kinase
MKYLLTGFFAVAFMAAVGQNNKTDSLETLLRGARNNADSLVLLNQLSADYRATDLEKALAYAMRAKSLAEAIADRKALTRSLLNAGMAHYYQGNHDDAMDFYLRSLNLAEKSADTSATILALNELATLEKKNADVNSAERHLLKALDLSREMTDSAMIAHSMNNLGHVYELKGDPGKAMTYYTASAAIKEKLKDFYAAAYNYDNIGNIMATQGRYDEAKKFFDKEIAIFSQLHDRNGYAIALNNMGEMYNLKKDFSKSREYLFSSLAESRAIGYKDLRRHIYNVISETYRQEKNFEQAYLYFVSGAALKDSIYNEQKSKQFQDLQTRYETEKKEDVIELLSRENEIKDFGLRQNRLFILGLIVMVLGMIIVGYLWQNRTRLKQTAELESTRATLRESQLEAVIASQEEERKRFAADLHDGLGQIISALRLSLSKENPAKNTVDYALTLLNDMNVEIRNIAFNLMPQALMKDGLEQALIEFASHSPFYQDIQRK